jgi:hypothetical protein
MSLIDRLANIAGPEVPNIAVNTFWAMLYEMAKGFKTRRQIIDYFALDTEESIELDWLIGRYNAQPNATAKASFVEQIQVIFYLAEARVDGYTSNAELAARISAI